jgi:hypothetical protein
MRVAVTILIALLGALTIPATAEVVTNDRTDIQLIVFVPCAASGAAGRTGKLCHPQLLALEKTRIAF